MEYAQTNEAGTDAIQVTTHGPVLWDERNYCSAEALVKDGKADQFRVVPLIEIPMPTYDPITQSVIRDGCEFVGGQWQYKWRIDALSAEQITINQAAKAAADARQLAANENTLWQAADAYEKQYISGVAIGLLTMGVMQQLPKSVAIAGWSGAIWTDYYTRKATVTATTTPSLDFSNHGSIPYSVPELRAELGM